MPSPIVEDAVERNPAEKSGVPVNVMPPVIEPMEAVFAFSVVEVAVPKYAVPVTVSAVDDAYVTVPVFAESDPEVSVPIVAVLEKKFVLDAVVAKNEVVVAAPALKRVDDAIVEKKVVEVAFVSVVLPEKVLLSERSVVEAPRAARVDS